MQRFHRNISFLSLLVGLFLLVSCTSGMDRVKTSPEAINGVIDLRDWDFSQDGTVELNGEWVFIPNEFLSPEVFSQNVPAQFVPVPQAWDKYDIKGFSDCAEGYGTYGLTLLLPENDVLYGLTAERLGTAYTLFVNGQELSRLGQNGTSLEEMVPNVKPVLMYFHNTEASLEIVIQISNYYHRNGGFTDSLVLGKANQVQRERQQNWFIDIFSIGALFVMGMYHLLRYGYRPQSKVTLWFGVLCWSAAIRIGVTNQCIFLYFLPEFPWTMALRIEYLTFFLPPAIFTLFLKSLYPEDVDRWFLSIALVFAGGFSTLIFFLNTLTLSYSAVYYQLVILLEIVYFLYFLVRIIIKKREGVVVIGVASLIVFLTIILEIITVNFNLPIGQISAYGFLAFIFVQSVLISSRSSKTLQAMETLSTELQTTNINLIQSEHKYRKIFEDSKDMIVIIGRDSRIEDVSPACESILGYTPEEMIHKEASELLGNVGEVAKYVDPVSHKSKIHNLEAELIRKDGERIMAVIDLDYRFNEKGESVGYQGSVRDITAQKQIEAERRRSHELEKIAITDPLTHIYNRRFFYEVAQKELARVKRSNSDLSLIIFDIDHFKQVNDTYGHLVGDEVLINLALLCQANIRSMDMIARFGGEEFVILLPDTDNEAAYEMAERLRQVVAQTSLAFALKTDVHVTASMGLSSWIPMVGDVKIDDLLNLADQALYQAKRAGRNRTKAWNNNRPTVF